jgi:hypothetical protein
MDGHEQPHNATNCKEARSHGFENHQAAKAPKTNGAVGGAKKDV